MNAVPTSIPLTSMIPMLFRAPAPGPVASTSGKCPTTVAAVVIKIGRSRVPAASMMASQFLLSRFLEMIGELDNQDAVLRDQTHQRNQSDLAVDVQRRETQEREQQRAGNRQRNGTCQDNERIAEAFELRREHEINQNRRQQESAEKAATLSELPRFTRVIDGEALWQNLLRLLSRESPAPGPTGLAGGMTPWIRTALSC